MMVSAADGRKNFARSKLSIEDLPETLLLLLLDFGGATSLTELKVWTAERELLRRMPLLSDALDP